MPTLELTTIEARTLRTICREHMERVGKRATIPQGKKILDVADEIALCERVGRDTGVEIGEKRPTGSGSK